MITIEYMFEGDNMTDEEFENQDDKVFEITKDMIYELIMQNVEIPEGLELDWENIFVK